MSGKTLLFALVVLIVLTLGSGAVLIRSLMKENRRIQESVSLLENQTTELKNTEESLQNRLVREAVFRPIPKSEDPHVNAVLLKSVVLELLKEAGLEGEVRVIEKKTDPSFPPMVKIDAVPIEVGIDDYGSYGQILDFVEELRDFPLVLESFCYGCTGIAIPGKLRMRLVYYEAT